jgi:hypothetical protein
MTEKKHKARIALQRSSEALIAEVSSGKWSHASGLTGKPIEQWTEVIASLESQCPGHPHQEYISALIRANRDNR